MEKELDVMQMERKIRRRVKKQMEKSQREYYLNEQMKAIQQELGEEDDEISEYQAKIDKANLSDTVREKLNKELSRLAKTPFGAAESTVLRNYLDACLEIPFGVYTESETDVAAAIKKAFADAVAECKYQAGQ